MGQNILTMNIAGRDFPILETVIKPKPGQDPDPTKTYYCFRMPKATSGAFGVQLPALETSLPSRVTIDGVVVSLLPGRTAGEYKDRATKNTVVIPESERRNLTEFSGLQTLPSLKSDTDEGIRQVDVKVSETKDGQWNVKVIVRKHRESASPEERAKAAERKAQDNLATFAAIFESFAPEMASA